MNAVLDSTSSDRRPQYQAIVRLLLDRFPTTQAIYLFGSYGTEDEWPTSDVDIALLLPPAEAKTLKLWDLVQVQSALSSLLHRSVDLLNLRRVSTVFKKEVVMADRRIFTADENAADEFEMLTLSLYQKLNAERAAILAEGLKDGRFYDI